MLACRCATTAPASQAAPREAGRRAPPEAARPAPALGRPSIHPDFREGIVAAEKLRSNLDGFFASRHELKTQPRAADFWIGVRYHVAHLALVERDRSLDLSRRNAIKFFAAKI